jgi:hypothetical protein
VDNFTTLVLVVVGVNIFAAVVNLITVAVMFAKLANTIGRVLEKAIMKEVSEVKNG